MLVHGAWHGGWCWRRVADRLEAAGHKVYTPTLTGLADRSHLLTPSVTLDTHVLDVVNLIDWEGLRDVVLCGHSYAGFVVSRVVERIPDRIGALVFVDAYLPQHGQTMFELAGSASRASIEVAMRTGAATRPAPSAESFNVNRRDRAWVDGKMTPQPLGVALQPIQLTGARERVARKAYVRATRYASPAFDAALAAARRDAGWRTFEVASGHDVMIDAPDELVAILRQT